jgi:small-conductance mechanosensitive channel
VLFALLGGWLALGLVWAVWAAQGGKVLPDGQLAIELTQRATLVQNVLLAFLGVLLFAGIAWFTWRQRVRSAVTFGLATVAAGVVVESLNLFILFAHDSAKHGHGGLVLFGDAVMAVLWSAFVLVFVGTFIALIIGAAVLVGVIARRVTESRRADIAK